MNSTDQHNQLRRGEVSTTEAARSRLGILVQSVPAVLAHEQGYHQDDSRATAADVVRSQPFDVRTTFAPYAASVVEHPVNPLPEAPYVAPAAEPAPAAVSLSPQPQAVQETVQAPEAQPAPAVAEDPTDAFRRQARLAVEAAHAAQAQVN